MATNILKNSNISNLGNQDSTQAFIDCILLYSKNLEADAVSIELQELFFKLSEQRNQLPGNASNNLIDSFLASLVSIISINPEYKLSIRAIQILFNYLKNDPKVFKRFKPNKVIIKNMNMTAYVLSQNFKDQELALDFCAFLLRYHKEIDYNDFSDDQYVVNKIRRAEIYRSWADIEDLANGYETINTNFEKHRTVTSNAFQEIVKLVEKVKAECLSIASQGVPLGGNTQSEQEFRRDIASLKTQLTNVTTQISTNQQDQTRFTNFQSQVQNELNRINDQQIQFDNNLKLLAEGTLSLSEKEKQFALKVEIMRKDLQNMATNIETRLDTKLSSVETGQKVNVSTIENQMESGFKRFNDQLNILEKRMSTMVDEKCFESRKLGAETYNKNLDSLKYDYESLINRTGSQLQELVSRVKNETSQTLATNKRELEDKVWQQRTEIEDMMKNTKISMQEDALKFKEEIRLKLDESELRTHKEFSKLLDDTTQAIEDSINTNLIGQMKEIDVGLKDVTNRVNNMDQTVHIHNEKVQKMEDSLNDHIDLIESLNRKLDKQAQTIEDNKGMIIEKLGIFEAGVINELKEATSHFSFKAYEDSFRKIETDMDTFYKELLKMREDFDVKNKDLADWKLKLGQDLLNFYKKYDGSFAENSHLGKMERDSLNTTINEISDNLAKNRQSIQLLAKEISVLQSGMSQLKDSTELNNQEQTKANAGYNKQIQDIYQQMRKFTSDVLDQVKNIKGTGDNNYVLEREREYIRQQMQRQKDEVDLRVKELWNDVLGMKDQLAKIRQTGVGDSKLIALQNDLKNLTQVIQKFIDEHMQDKLTLLRSKNKSFEAKIDSLEWLSRYANFYSPDNVYVMLTTFKEIYTGSDVNYRNAYISAQHGSDAVFIILANIKKEMQKLTGIGNSQQSVSQSIAFNKNLTGNQSVVMQSNETKIAFLLNIMEPILVNDMNNEYAIENGILEMLVQLLKTQDVNRQVRQSTQLRPYIKFALRCLTSAIRTELAVNRFYNIDGGVTKVLEILEFVDDQELIANSCKIVRICLRDETVYEKMAQQYPALANLIIEKMLKWSNSLPIIQESSSAIRNYVRKVEYARSMRVESIDVLVDLARDGRYDKIRPVIQQALKMMSRSSEFDGRIRQKGAQDLLQGV